MKSEDLEARGAAITKRRTRLGINSVSDLATRAGVDRGTVTKAENGNAAVRTYQQLEAWLDRFEEEIGANDEPDNGLVEFRLTGNFGVDVVVRGPVSDIDKLRAAVSALMSDLGESGSK